jgi:hypothetical protein
MPALTFDSGVIVRDYGRRGGGGGIEGLVGIGTGRGGEGRGRGEGGGQGSNSLSRCRSICTGTVVESTCSVCEQAPLSQVKPWQTPLDTPARVTGAGSIDVVRCECIRKRARICRTSKGGLMGAGPRGHVVGLAWHPVWRLADKAGRAIAGPGLPTVLA